MGGTQCSGGKLLLVPLQRLRHFSFSISHLVVVASELIVYCVLTTVITERVPSANQFELYFYKPE
jgi:hypothetical protein